ncbi:nitrate/nitrite transport system permease protein [Povalibacter uvarum]|uniref:Nitrate/nitrite transport system permease protein n=1 Tax=Povalibacter uvarum TaxID=732238 RepID=A0A841HWF5_9GAMM|nr:ABC transporter permease [Povalibacter uvarum]MBB6096579.1 nitrate/nitrite transport system permease protein [Povalibacter uvarum]
MSAKRATMAKEAVNQSTATPAALPPAANAERVRQPIRLDRVFGALEVIGLGFVAPIVRMVRGEDTRAQAKELWQSLGIPLLAVAVFLFAWSQLSSRIETSLGTIPGPVAVWQQSGALWEDHKAERAKADAFYERQAKRSAEKRAEDPNAEIVVRKYTGKPTYIDQIFTSLRTVFMGFVLATVVAVPVGILCGLSTTINSALNPLIQVFKPVSPLAWLPLVTMVVSALYVSTDPMFEKSFLVSAITVTLCSLWPTIINTAVGVASIDKDLLNVAKVLRLPWQTKLFKLVMPSSLPLIFTGMRLSLGVGWMVLIASEMLAQNPGLGKFVWDEFQNGSSDSLARLMVAVLTIGIIGFILDRVMLTAQSAFSFGARR